MSFGSEYRQAKQDEKSATLVALTLGGIGSAVVAGCLVFGVMLYDKITEKPSSYHGLDGTERTAAAKTPADPQRDYERCKTIVNAGLKLQGGYMRMLGFGQNADIMEQDLGQHYGNECRQRTLGRTDAD